MNLAMQSFEPMSSMGFLKRGFINNCIRPASKIIFSKKILWQMEQVFTRVKTESGGHSIKEQRVYPSSESHTESMKSLQTNDIYIEYSSNDVK